MNAVLTPIHCAGLDYGIRCPAACVLPYSESDELTPFDQCHFYYITEVKSQAIDRGNIHGFHLTGYSAATRYSSIADYFVGVFKEHNVQQIGLEGYAYNAKGNSQTALAENVGLLKYLLHQNGIAYNVHPPTTLKKYSTGKGNASKDDMLATFEVITGVDLNGYFGRAKAALSKSPVSDLVDAYMIANFQRMIRHLEEVPDDR